jgi:5-methylcytosine-specific restriction endonuclease McrA
MPFKDAEKRRAYHRAYIKKWAKKNKARAYAHTKKWRSRNRERFNAKLYAWRKANPEKAKAMQDRWYKKHGRKYYAKNRTKRRVAQKRCYAKERLLNLEQQKARRRRYYHQHKHEINTAIARDRAQNPEKYHEIDTRRWKEDRDRRTLHNFIQRAKRYNVRLYCTASEWLALLKKFEFKCFYCATILTKQTRTLDHKLPLSRGGTNEIENLVPACRRCNHRKGKKTAEEFFC